jgi:cob(I)alamin adenosyltransferase
VYKDDIRVEICGCVDEASSFLGMAKCVSRDRKIRALIDGVQRSLSALCAEISGAPRGAKKFRRVGRDAVCVIEKEIKRFEGRRAVRVSKFCLQGANLCSGALDVARAVIRTAERRCVTLHKKRMLANRNIIVYLNRLSDLLFLLARYSEKRHA